MLPNDLFYRPLYPEDHDQGDPYFLPVLASAGAQCRFYAYVTRDEAGTRNAIIVYGTNDLRRWKRFGAAVEAPDDRRIWAACVQYIPELEYPFVMLHSQSYAQWQAIHIDHKLVRKHSKTPEGPFIDSGHTLTPDSDFAIDPDVYRLPNGAHKLAFATHILDQNPYGVGIVETSINADLTAIQLDTEVVLVKPTTKGRFDIYDPARKLPWLDIPGIDWATEAVEWHVREGPIGGLVNQFGEDVYLYSAGSYIHTYVVGAVVRRAGRLIDVTAEMNHFVWQPQPEQGIYATGHPSLARIDATGSVALLSHCRFGSPDARRQMVLVPLFWNAAGFPYCPSHAR